MRRCAESSQEYISLKMQIIGKVREKPTQSEMLKPHKVVKQYKRCYQKIWGI